MVLAAEEPDEDAAALARGDLALEYPELRTLVTKWTLR